MSADGDDTVEPAYELVMPFVNVTSRVGRYDDDAFVAGFTCGALDERLASGVRLGQLISAEVTVPAGVVAQVDLMAMRHGWTVERLAWSDDINAETASTWAQLRLRYGGPSLTSTEAGSA